ncbi:MAG: hypothetical protein JEZ05_05870 [Tenericutes bacterium]|nr:hypothetical protein [Mycoplasmatota bacterium]
MKIKKLLLLLVLTLNLIMLMAFTVSLEAKSAYKTYTLDREDELVETSEAYEAIDMIRYLSDGTTLDSAKDMFIDEDDYMYIADTGNQRIVILDPDLEVVTSFGTDLLVKPLGIHVVDDFIYVADYGLGKTNEDLGSIYIWEFDKEAIDPETSITLVDTFSTPSSHILEVDNFIFRPIKIAVDKNHTMYVVNEGTTSGVLMINSSNRFVDYFASNYVDLSLWDRIERILYQYNDNVYLTKNIPTPVYNVAMDGKGYFYTVTQNSNEDSQGDNLKKINIGGINYFEDDMFVYNNIVDAWIGDVENVFCVTSSGFLFEYDNLGNLLFTWGGPGVGNDKLGLLVSASTIALDSKNNIYVIDDNANRNSIQIFRETLFAKKVHEALDLYNHAMYSESIGVWEEVLRYNSMLDVAYQGIGLGRMMDQDYELAMENFEICRDQEHYSEAFWEVRNIFLIENMTSIIYFIFGFILLFNLVKLTNRRYNYLGFVGTTKTKVLKVKPIRQFFYMFHFIKNPFDAIYGVKVEKRASMLSAWLILGLLFVIHIASLLYTGFIFNNVIIEQTILVKEGLKIVIPIVIFIISNYLMSSLMEGEGTFKTTFINLIGSLMPIIIIYPILIIISNVLTLNESFIYYLGFFIATAWCVFLVFFNIKDTHNYSVSQTLVNIFLSIIFMIIIIIILLMVYLMVTQVVNFGTDIIKEVILRE